MMEEDLEELAEFLGFESDKYYTSKQRMFRPAHRSDKICVGFPFEWKRKDEA
jgi:hypothetical protein